MNPVDDTWLQLGCKQMDVFEQHPEAYMQLLVTGLNQRVIMSMCYRQAVKHKLVNPIEQLDENTKRILWERAKELSAGRLDNNQTIELSKALYTIQEFMTK